MRKDDEGYNLQAEQKSQEEKQKLHKNVNAADRKRKAGINTKKRRRKGNRHRHKKGMNARRETKVRQGTTGKDQTISP